jgi:hypothetical protein
VEVAHAVLHSLEAYLRTVGAHALGWYVDEAGDPQELNSAGWDFIRNKLLTRKGGIARLKHSPDGAASFAFEYYGKPLDARLIGDETSPVCAMSFRLPTEFLEEHGPAQVRELALELAAPLPFCSGHAGLAFQGELDVVGVAEKLAPYCFRYPGIDVPSLEFLGWRLGTRIRGPSWLTFLGQPVLGELGGTTALRSRLRAPGTTVQEMEGGRALVTLGEWPEAGDTERGDSLPAYRELARVLEPWLFHNSRGSVPCVSQEDAQRWERRFLD